MPKIEFFNAGQGLVSISIDGKSTDWKISNVRGSGVWRLYKAETFCKLETNLAKIIHHREKLAPIVWEFIQAN